MRPCTLLIIGLMTLTQAAHAETMKISPGVYKNYQDYLAKVEQTDSGTFAVSLDGSGSYFVYCPSNASCGSVTEALGKCRELNDMECRVFAKGKSPEVEFEIATREVKATEGGLADALNTDAIKKLIVGNSQVGEYENNVAWREYFSPNGTFIGHVDPNTEYTGRYEIENNSICYDYEGTVHDWCARISVENGNVHQFNLDGKLQIDLEDTRFIQGNAFEGAREPVKF